MRTNISKEAAIRRAINLFDGIEGDTASVRDLFLLRGRNLEREEKNKLWLSNLIAPMKQYNIVEPLYGRRNNRRVLDRIRLTFEGSVLVNAARLNKHGAFRAGTSPSASVSPSPSLSSEAEAFIDESGIAKISVSSDTNDGILEQHSLFPDTHSFVSLPDALKAILRYNETFGEFVIEYKLRLRGTSNVARKG
jgi:hypothetical protein